MIYNQTKDSADLGQDQIPVQGQINTRHSSTADIPTAVLASTEYYHGRITSERPPGCSKLYALMTALPPSKT